ncbi:DUF6804 family protein [Chryseobacterium salivictor]|nr:DUF6804 family protein [Chryseobacterium salivictor]
MPYGYYQLVRHVSFTVFVYLAYSAYKENNDFTAVFWIYLFLAILFQPFMKIALGRTIWNIVDVAVAIWLIVNATKKRTES